MCVLSMNVPYEKSRETYLMILIYVKTGFGIKYPTKVDVS